MIDRKIEMFFISIVVMSSLSFASYCSLDFGFSLIYYQNISGNITSFLNMSNFTKINQTTYKYELFDNNTNVTHIFNMVFDCNKTKTFFLIFENLNTTFFPNVEYNVTGNESINLTFIISPVFFGNYVVKEHGVFGDNESEFYIDSPLTISRNYTFPFMPEGRYYHVFEISNGKETRYVNYIFRSVVFPDPEILEVYKSESFYGKNSSVSIFGRNIKNASITLLPSNKTIAMENVTKDYFKASFLISDEKVERIIIKGWNEHKNITKEINFSLKQNDLSNTTIYPSIILYPGLTTNRTTKIKLIEFNTDVPILIETIETRENYFGESKFFDYYITNERGERYEPSYPFKAKEIYLFLLASIPSRGLINITLKSFTITDKEITLDFLATNEEKPNEVNITYYSRQVSCKAEGENVINSSYICKFIVLPNEKIENLQSQEIELLKNAFQERINLLEDNLKKEKEKFNLTIMIFIVIVIAVVIYLTREFWARLFFALR